LPALDNLLPVDEERSGQIGDVVRKGLALLVGMAVVIALGTWLLVRVLGLDDTGDATDVVGTPQPAHPLPSTALPVPSDSASPDDETSEEPAEPTGESTGPSPGSSVPGAPDLRLSITPLTAAPMERLNVTGTYAGHDNVSLQVQRREGGVWADFPTTARVNMGTFETYVKTSHPGPNRFRVYDPAEDKASNVITIIIS
jgi:hypothetical protein